MTLLEVSNVSRSNLESTQLRGARIDTPVTGSQTDVYALDIVGWVLGCTNPATAVEIIYEGTVVRRVPVNIRRPDVATAFPDVPGAETSGFGTTVSVLGLGLEFELGVRAVLQDKSHVPISQIQVRRRSMRSKSTSKLQPLMLTTLGRSGSTWVLWLLGQHSSIVTYQPFKYEPRVGSYWMHILKALSEPQSYLQALAPNLSDNTHWWLGNKPRIGGLPDPDPHIKRWLGQTQVEIIASVCQQRVEAFYEQVAVTQGQAEPMYFAEKYSFDYFVRGMTQELFPQAREIFLIRDVRDMFCSILAYNAKQGRNDFGRGEVTSDEEYIQWLQFHALRLLENWKRRSSHSYLLRYEDLVLRPEEALDAILNYLNLSPTTAVIEEMLEKASRDTPDVQQHRTSLNPRASIGRWRRDLDEPLYTACQSAFASILQEFGYAE